MNSFFCSSVPSQWKSPHRAAVEDQHEPYSHQQHSRGYQQVTSVTRKGISEEDLGEKKVPKKVSEVHPPKVSDMTCRKYLFGNALQVGVTGFEPATSSSRTKRSTKLSYTP